MADRFSVVFQVDKRKNNLNSGIYQNWKRVNPETEIYSLFAIERKDNQ